MLSKTMFEKLNQQINLEAYSSNLYLQMSSWCNAKGLDGCAKFMYKHAEEERAHMTKLFNYVNNTGEMAILGSVDAPVCEFANITDIFTQTLTNEREITASINSLVDLALNEKDYSTFNFLQWYVGEQHEEERLVNTILDKIKVIGPEGRGLYHIDHSVSSMVV